MGATESAKTRHWSSSACPVRLMVARPRNRCRGAAYRKCVRRLQAALLLVLVGLPFEPLRQFLVANSDCAHPPSCWRIFHRVGSRQHLFGAHSQVAGAQQELVDFF